MKKDFVYFFVGGKLFDRKRSSRLRKADVEALLSA